MPADGRWNLTRRLKCYWLVLIKKQEQVYCAVRNEFSIIVRVINASLLHMDLRNLTWFQSSMRVWFCHNIR